MLQIYHMYREIFYEKQEMIITWLQFFHSKKVGLQYGNYF